MGLFLVETQCLMWQLELWRGCVPCLFPVSRWVKLEFLCVSENLKACVFPERTSLALQGTINFPPRLLRFLSLKSWITFLSVPPVIYRWSEQAFSCRSLAVYLLGCSRYAGWDVHTGQGVWGRDAISRAGVGRSGED